MAGYLLRIELYDIWREVIIPEKISFYDLHRVIQELFDWDGDFYHMHDFSLPKLNLRIVMDIEEESDDRRVETVTAVDDYFKHFKVVDYCYDFGDQWRHSILVKKYIPDYSLRHPVLVGFEGKNYTEDWIYEGELPEDSGVDLDGRYALDAGKVTSSFESWNFSVLEPDEDDSMGLEEMLMMQDYIAQISAKQSTRKRSRGKGKGASEPVQDDALALLKKIYRKAKWEKKETHGSMWKQILKYGEEKCFGCLEAESFTEHPEYLLYVLKKTEMEELLSLWTAGCGTLQTKPKQKTLEKWVRAGLVIFEADVSGKSVTGYLSLTEECESMLREVLSLDWKGIIRKHSAFMKKLDVLLQIYFAVELEQISDIYRKTYLAEESEWCQEEVLLHGIFGRSFRVSVQDDSIFLSLKEIDVSAVLEQRSSLRKVAGKYQIYEKKQIERMEYGIQYAVNAWRKLEFLLREVDFYTSQNISMCIRELYYEVSMGLSLQDLVKHLISLLPPYTVDDSFQIWDLAMDIAVTTPLAILYGYSRNDFAEVYDVNPFSLSLFGEEMHQEREKKELHLYELPAQEQQMLYYMFHSEKKEEAFFHRIETVIKEYDGNEELQLFYGWFCYYSEKKKKGERILKKYLEE